MISNIRIRDGRAEYYSDPPRAACFASRDEKIWQFLSYAVWLLEDVVQSRGRIIAVLDNAS